MSLLESPANEHTGTLRQSPQAVGLGRPWLRWALGFALLATAWVAVTTNDATQPASDALVAPRLTRLPSPALNGSVPGLTAARQPAATPSPESVADSAVPASMVRSTPLLWPKLGAGGLAAWGPPQPPPAAKGLALKSPPPNPPTPPAPPRAPPFPYQLVGRLQQGDLVQALMAGPVRTVALRVGEVVEGQWRVDKVDSSAVHVTWLPGDQAQRIEYGSPP